ncbi:MAG: YceH family protein [Granulosicoccus sp.]
MQDTNLPDNEPSDNQDVEKPPQLLAMELRVLGVLMEKQLTTPDQYPLTLNGILTACNQKSSREPVTNYHQGEVLHCLRELEDRHYVRKEFGSRSDKYTQQFVPQLELNKKHQALLCIMMLRGPQTLNELHTRTQRMQQFGDRDELDHYVERLCERDVPYAMHLGTPGQRGARIAHLFSGMPEFVASAATESAAKKSSCSVEDFELLKDAVQKLELENTMLRQQMHTLYKLTGHELP